MYMDFGRRNRRASYAALTLTLAFAASGCTTEAEDNACGIELNAKVNALVDASVALEGRAAEFQSDVDTACENIVTGLGGTLPAEGDDPAAYTQAVCQAAANAIATEVDDSSLTVTVAVAPPVCRVDAEAQFGCEADCYVDASCEPGTVEARCEPGELSVVCEGTCEASAYCESTGSVAVNCEGSCEGICTGECDGMVIENEAGAECQGECVGSCQGSCQIEADGGIECGAEARCRGECTGTATAPECHVELMPPACDVDADCQAACDAQASFNAECSQAEVVVEITGTGGETLQGLLETNLPVLIQVGQGLGGLVVDANALISSATGVLAEVNAIPACALVKADELLAIIEGVGAAAASVQVSVEVNVCVSGSTDGTAPSCGGGV
jgi:hypothetical protein